MQSGSSLSPNISAIVVAFIQVAGSAVSTFAIGSMSRKLLYSLTCLGVIVGLVAMGIHGFFMLFIELEEFAWVPIASLSFVVFVASVGLLPLTFVMLSELLPQKVKIITLKVKYFFKIFNHRFEALEFRFAQQCFGVYRFSL